MKVEELTQRIRQACLVNGLSPSGVSLDFISKFKGEDINVDLTVTIFYKEGKLGHNFSVFQLHIEKNGIQLDLLANYVIKAIRERRGSRDLVESSDITIATT